jgi:hypothetical protein
MISAHVPLLTKDELGALQLLTTCCSCSARSKKLQTVVATAVDGARTRRRMDLDDGRFALAPHRGGSSRGSHTENPRKHGVRNDSFRSAKSELGTRDSPRTYAADIWVAGLVQ